MPRFPGPQLRLQFLKRPTTRNLLALLRSLEMQEPRTLGMPHVVVSCYYANHLGMHALAR